MNFCKDLSIIQILNIHQDKSYASIYIQLFPLSTKLIGIMIFPALTRITVGMHYGPFFSGALTYRSECRECVCVWEGDGRALSAPFQADRAPFCPGMGYGYYSDGFTYRHELIVCTRVCMCVCWRYVHISIKDHFQFSGLSSLPYVQVQDVTHHKSSSLNYEKRLCSLVLTWFIKPH